MNRDIAARLEEAAWLLRDQGADPCRVNTCLRAQHERQPMAPAAAA